MPIIFILSFYLIRTSVSQNGCLTKIKIPPIRSFNSIKTCYTWSLNLLLGTPNYIYVPFSIKNTNNMPSALRPCHMTTTVIVVSAKPLLTTSLFSLTSSRFASLNNTVCANISLNLDFTTLQLIQGLFIITQPTAS